jgi:intein-encoded DNA endonuclease-like protein
MIFQTTNKILCEFFKLLGKYPNSIESHEKVLNFIPEKYHRYFLRGLIDGDGCFYINEKNYSYQFNISSRYEQDWDYLKKYFQEELQVISSIYRREHENSKSSILRITDLENLKKLIIYLYNEVDEIFLERKFIKSKEILLHCK